MAPGAFRLLLASLVVVAHLSRYEVGLAAVMCFFTLSGYWVMAMYDRKCRPEGVGVFYLSRAMRIWLPFAVAAVVGAIAHAMRGAELTPLHLASFGLLGIASHRADLTGVAWSLDIELQFYLLVPLIWIVASTGSWQRGGRGALIVLAGSLSLWAVGAALERALDVSTVLTYAPSFAAGVLIWKARAKVTGRLALLSVLLFLAAGGMVLAVEGTRFLLVREGAWGEFRVPFATAWALLLLPFIAWNVAQRSGPIDRHLGSLSFSLYIVHLPVIHIAQGLWFPDAFGRPEKLVTVAVVALASVAFYVVVDRTSEAMRAGAVAAAVRRRHARRYPVA